MFVLVFWQDIPSTALVIILPVLESSLYSVRFSWFLVGESSLYSVLFSQGYPRLHLHALNLPIGSPVLFGQLYFSYAGP